MSIKFTIYWLLFWALIMFGSAIHAGYHHDYTWMSLFILLTIYDGVIFYKLIKENN